MQENERQRVSCGKFCNFCFQNSYFSPQEMDEFSDRLSTASIKCLNWPSPVFGRFQNGCNKVVIELSGVQFGLKSYAWFEITSMISEQNCPTRGSITIIYHSSVPEYFWNRQWYTLSWNKAIHSSQRKANLAIINLRKTLKVEKQSEQSFCANCLPNMWEVNRNSTLNSTRGHLCMYPGDDNG